MCGLLAHILEHGFLSHRIFCEILDRIEICALLGYNAASSGNPLSTFRDSVAVSSSRVKKSKKSLSSWTS
jgi:hypothetical protein